MKVYAENNVLNIVLGERIDYSNAGEVEAELFDALKNHPGLPLCLDADKLLYISSAGLRIMMRLRKACTAGFSIRNVSSAVYEIFEMTGMTQIIDVRKKRRRFETKGLPVIGKGASGTVYKLDEETVIKVYKGGEMMLIDMDHLCTGNPVFEFAGLYTTYIALNEVDPNDSLNFLGLDKETCSELFYGTLREYLQAPDEDRLRPALQKIRTAGYLRLLMLLVVERKIADSDKKERGIKHAVSRLGELAYEVQELAI